MPELPEVETVRRTLKNFVIGKKIEKVSLHYDKIITGNREYFINAIVGQKIRDIDRVGKYLVFILDHHAFISHLRMEGKYRITDSEKPLNKHEHLVLHLSDKMQLRYQDTRKFGRFELVNKETYRQDPPLNKLGPEPWDCNPNRLYQRMQRSSLPLKTLLLDQSIIAGIGNIYANEICFAMKLNPKIPGNRLRQEHVTELVAVSQQILNDAIAQGGTTIHSFDANGISGLFQVRLQVHMQKKCQTCGGEIIKEMVHGRGTYYCKICQEKKY